MSRYVLLEYLFIIVTYWISSVILCIKSDLHTICDPYYFVRYRETVTNRDQFHKQDLSKMWQWGEKIETVHLYLLFIAKTDVVS